MISRFRREREYANEAVSSGINPTEGLVIETIIQIFGFDRPMSADHAFKAAANDIAPVKFLFVSVDKITPQGPVSQVSTTLVS